MTTDPDPAYIEETMRAVERLWRAIMVIKQQDGQEVELDRLQAALTVPHADRMLLVLECLAVVAEEVARLQRQVGERQ